MIAASMATGYLRWAFVARKTSTVRVAVVTRPRSTRGVATLAVPAVRAEVVGAAA
jgi:hypothetical protein